MNFKELIALNNEKREQLNEENLAYYEDMLVYIRLNFNKSEQQTEETLLELLEHVLQAQSEGRSAKEVFGDDPKAYCQELIGEMPKEQMKQQIPFIVHLVLQFLGIISLVTGVVRPGLYYLFDLGTNTVSISLGKGLMSILFYLLLLFSFILIIFIWIKHSSFKEKQPKKWVEFIQLWVVGVIHIGLFIFVPKVIPDFGTVLTIPALWFAVIGGVLYLVSYLFKRNW
ncbi:DUF1129 family protein [Lentibacillus sp. Marseille-P4043]|uniref:DUF1129 family protein n=1 Tax=Lentibacillus sp. Marseille-P4043 TaxID=2040293 RepID=UPI000D0B9C1A|nr:DUF1129 family protein [Lentibacillus sp. Marseille-P4043]